MNFGWGVTETGRKVFLGHSYILLSAPCVFYTGFHFAVHSLRCASIICVLLFMYVLFHNIYIFQMSTHFIFSTKLFLQYLPHPRWLFS